MTEAQSLPNVLLTLPSEASDTCFLKIPGNEGWLSYTNSTGCARSIELDIQFGSLPGFGGVTGVVGLHLDCVGFWPLQCQTLTIDNSKAGLIVGPGYTALFKVESYFTSFGGIGASITATDKPAPFDSDGDGVCDGLDNCSSPNPGQEDADGDGVGDACDLYIGSDTADSDGDGLPDVVDFCSGPNVDCNGNGIGDSCDLSRNGRLTLFNTSEGFPWAQSGQSQIAVDPTGVDPTGHVAVTNGQEAGSGSLTFIPVSPLPVETFVVDFLVQVEGGTGDGFSFVLYDDAQYPEGLLFGDEGLDAGALSVLFDTFQDPGDPNANHIELRYGGQSLSVIVPNFQLASGEWLEFRCELLNGKLSLSGGPIGTAPELLFSGFDIPGFTPFVAGYGFGGASGASPATIRFAHLFFDSQGSGFSGDLDGTGLLDVCEHVPSQVSRSGALTTNEALVPVSPSGPRMGQAYFLRISHETFVPSAVSDFLFVGLQPVDIPLPPFGSLLVPADSLTLPATPNTSIAVPIPIQPILFSLPISFQGASLGVDQGVTTIELTNAIDVQVGAWI